MKLEKLEKIDKNIVEMEVSVDADEFEKAVDASYRKNIRKMNVPGFRRGKAPRKMVEKNTRGLRKKADRPAEP